MGNKITARERAQFCFMYEGILSHPPHKQQLHALVGIALVSHKKEQNSVI